MRFIPPWWGFGLVVLFVLLACVTGPILVCTHHDCGL